MQPAPKIADTGISNGALNAWSAGPTVQDARNSGWEMRIVMGVRRDSTCRMGLASGVGGVLEVVRILAT